jgi:chromosome segregation ATPase
MKLATRLFIIILLIMSNLFLAVYALDTERRADQWNRRVTAFEHVRQLNLEILRANERSELLAEAVRMLANENGILCERDKASMEVVAQYEEENRKLEASLYEACELIDEQQEEIDDYIDEIADLEEHIEALEELIDVLAGDDADELLESLDSGIDREAIFNYANTLTPTL